MYRLLSMVCTMVLAAGTIAMMGLSDPGAPAQAPSADQPAARQTHEPSAPAWPGISVAEARPTGG